MALRAWEVQERLGSPEGELAIAQAVAYLSVAAKSNAVCKAVSEIKAVVNATGSLDVPLHIRNAPTSMMKDMGYGEDYRYAHNHEGAFVPGESYLPPELDGRRFYNPVERGLEAKIKQRLEYLRKLNEASDFQRYANDSKKGQE